MIVYENPDTKEVFGYAHVTYLDGEIIGMAIYAPTYDFAKTRRPLHFLPHVPRTPEQMIKDLQKRADRLRQGIDLRAVRADDIEPETLFAILKGEQEGDVPDIEWDRTRTLDELFPEEENS